MNGQLFMRTEQKKKAGGENALPRWTSVILTSLLLHCDVLHEETATGASNCSLLPLHASQHATKSQSDYPDVLLRCTLFMPALSKDLASHTKKKKRKEKGIECSACSVSRSCFILGFTAGKKEGFSKCISWKTHFC